jgi:hypothetical protein
MQDVLPLAERLDVDLLRAFTTDPQPLHTLSTQQQPGIIHREAIQPHIADSLAYAF